MPLMNHTVAAVLIAVAIPKAANVREPVVPVPPKYMLSDACAIVTVAPVPATNAILEPIGKLAGTVAVQVAEK